MKWAEQHLYGSSRIGIVKTEVVANGLASDVYSYTLANDPVGNGIKGKRVYELSNHLGNVMATISDRKMGVDVNSDGQVDYFEAEVLSQSDYYPFGMKMKDRSYGVQGRYGFNGKENDDETGWQDYGMRIYDRRLGRFLSVDPLSKKFAFYTPYQFAGNNSIQFVDLDGLEPAEPGKKNGEVASGSRQGEEGVRQWSWNGSIWEELALPEAVVYSSNYHKPLAPVVSEMYDGMSWQRNKQISEDLSRVIWKNSKLRKDILKQLPKIPQIPTPLEATKTLYEKYYKGMYDAATTIVSDRSEPIDMIAAGVGIVEPHLALAYDLILKRIFLDEMIKDVNIGVFELVDYNWKNTQGLNRMVKNQTMLRGGDYIGAITVTTEQFYDIMHNKFFIPSDYKFYPVDPSNVDFISKHFMNGERPAFNIYFNSQSSKGFLHVSEIGIAPVNSKKY